MESVELAPGIFHLQSGSNMGLIVWDAEPSGQARHHGLLIDAGLDKDAGRRALRIAEGMDVALEHVFITHAHADHFGGARHLRRRLGVEVYAPGLEAAIVQNPIIEPIYLYGGAAPIQELRHKFTLGNPCPVDHVVEPGLLDVGPRRLEVVALPGHAPNQVGLAIEEVLFCADAVFPQETLEKHKVIFCADLDQALSTLEQLPELPYQRFAPGHGPTYAAGREIEAVCAANRKRLMEIRQRVHEALVEPQGTQALIQEVANQFQLDLATATSYFLTRTTVLAALSSMEQAGEVRVRMERNQLLWRIA